LSARHRSSSPPGTYRCPKMAHSPATRGTTTRINPERHLRSRA
jgi:hypothetical protein